ncbi:hypothetical protein CRG98_014128 [Punica granatum]|uniref:Uncharacterized protein n=1 Tax=Punica granatum TaxID=22663 RepID=A0A2I0KB87_PUNGR|nr:hypothetical protein CRG98_014128 [Punica granatum]
MDCFGTWGETGMHGKLGMVARVGTTCLDPQEERLTRRPRLETDSRRRLANPRTRLSQCFPRVVESGWCNARTSTFSRMSFERKIPRDRGSFVVGMKGPLFPGSRSTREMKMGSEKQSETYSLVLVTLGCVQSVLSNYVFAPIGLPVNSDPSLALVRLCSSRCWRSLSEPVDQNGVLTV